jgi:hypothetical protein
MSVKSIVQARTFLSNVSLPNAPRSALEDATRGPSFDFDAAKNQAAVVGSEVVSFVKGVSPEQRGDIVRSSLLAQLVAKQRVPDGTRIYDWYDAYFDALLNIGWIVQERGFADYSEVSKDFEAHRAILQVATTLLGPGAAALAVVKATLDALKSMSADSPWITLFNRESQTANNARFQISLAEWEGKDTFLVSLMAFGLTAKSTLTQVLFFKFRSSDVSLKHCSGKVTVDSEVLAAVRPEITNMVTGFARTFVRSLPPLGA